MTTTAVQAQAHTTTTAHPCSSSSLILAHKPQGRLVVILGTGKLAFARARAAHEAGAVPLVVRLRCGEQKEDEDGTTVCSEIARAVHDGWVKICDAPLCTAVGDYRDEGKAWTAWLDALDAEDDDADTSAIGTAGPRIFALCITDTLHSAAAVEGGQDEPSTSAAGAATSATTSARARLLYNICKRKRIPINVADTPAYCDFSFPAVHRFPCGSSTGGGGGAAGSSLQVAVTTNGRGCRLAGRIRRDIVAALPRNVGDAVDKVGQLRDLAKESDAGVERAVDTTTQGLAQAQGQDYMSARPRPRPRTTRTATADEDDLSYDTTPLNSPVPQLSSSSSAHPQHLLARASSQLRLAQEQANNSAEAAARTKRRMRWVAQISEYWPIDYLGGMQEEQMHEVLRSLGEQEAASEGEGEGDATRGRTLNITSGAATDASRSITPMAGNAAERGRHAHADSTPTPTLRDRSQHSLRIEPPRPPRTTGRGHIYLIGSGPGHPGLLTLLAHRLLTSPDTHLVLSDKLVPAPILRLIPSSTPLVIAKKFPGNAEGAQSELIALALKAALEEGKNVVRLKQGDPFVYGRGGEEVLAFKKVGMQCTVIPGISSALAAPLMLGVPVTQRGAADSFILCTGVGRGGKRVTLPGYERGRSLVILMGVARLGAVIQVLTSPGQEAEGHRNGAAFPPYTPIAIIERASSSDQRILCSTLDGIMDALDACGEQRPPGMIMIGWAVLALEGREGNVDVLDDERECEGDAGELERRDRQRVSMWLDARGFLVREGLDDVYAKALVDLASARGGEADVEAAAAEGDQGAPTTNNGDDDVSTAAAAAPVSTPAPAHAHDLTHRTGTGWAPARYHPSAIPHGGWGPKEGANVPAHNAQEYAQHGEYVRALARGGT